MTTEPGVSATPLYRAHDNFGREVATTRRAAFAERLRQQGYRVTGEMEVPEQ